MVEPLIMGLCSNNNQEVTTMFLSFKQRFYRFMGKVAKFAFTVFVVAVFMAMFITMS